MLNLAQGPAAEHVQVCDVVLCSFISLSVTCSVYSSCSFRLRPFPVLWNSTWRTTQLACACLQILHNVRSPWSPFNSSILRYQKEVLQSGVTRSNFPKCYQNVSKTVVWYLRIWKRKYRIWRIASWADASEQSQILYVLYYMFSITSQCGKIIGAKMHEVSGFFYTLTNLWQTSIYKSRYFGRAVCVTVPGAKIWNDHSCQKRSATNSETPCINPSCFFPPDLLSWIPLSSPVFSPVFSVFYPVCSECGYVAFLGAQLR